MINQDSQLQSFGSELMKRPLFQALVFKISTEQELTKRTFDIKYKISQFLQQDIPYLRYQKIEGNFVINKRDIQDEQRVYSLLQQKGIYIDKPIVLENSPEKEEPQQNTTIEESKPEPSDIELKNSQENQNIDNKIFVNINICDYIETDEFYKRHTNHFLSIFKSTYGLDYIIYLEGNNYINKEESEIKTITIGGQKFKSEKELKNKMQSMIETKKLGDRIRQPEYSILNDLIKYHKNFKEKMNDFNYFTVNYNKKYSKTKCFNIMKKDGKLIDFSIQKCIHNAIKTKGFT